MTIATFPEVERRERTAVFSLEPEKRETGSRRLRGHAAVFNSESLDIGFIETILPGAFRDVLADPKTDALLYFGHSRVLPLARQSAGTLTLREDLTGLYFEAEVAKTQLGDDALELVRSGVVRQMSFAFSYAEDGVRWFHVYGKPHAEVSKVGRLAEISLVTEPAYTATSVEARAKATANRGGRLKAKPVCAYGPDSPFSFFRDAVEVAHAKKQVNAHLLSGNRYARQEGIASPFALRSEAGDTGGVRGARERLATVQRRDLELAPSDFPGYLGELFNTAARAKGVIANALPSAPLPELGLELELPRITAGSAVAVQPGQGDAVQETDPTVTSDTVFVATIVGQVDVQVQTLDRSRPGLDAVISRDLGADLGTKVDSQLVNGTGANGQTEGLLAAAVTSVAYTDATPTGAELKAKLWDAASQVATAYGSGGNQVTDLMILHARRYAWLLEELGADAVLPGAVLTSGVIPVTSGAGTNEDSIVLIAGGALEAGAVRALTSATEFRVMPDVGSGTLTVRLLVIRYVALAAPEPKAVAKVTGTGLITPTFA